MHSLRNTAVVHTSYKTHMIFLTFTGLFFTFSGYILEVRVKLHSVVDDVRVIDAGGRVLSHQTKLADCCTFTPTATSPFVITTADLFTVSCVI